MALHHEHSVSATRQEPNPRASWAQLTRGFISYSIVLGCPRTLPAGRHLGKAREIVAQSRMHPQVSVLLAELDLCLVSDPLGPPPGCGRDPGRADNEWDRIMASLDTTGTLLLSSPLERLQINRAVAHD
jgi:hypothetical protein